MARFLLPAALLLVVVLAPVLRAGEPAPPPVDPARVARLLLSLDAGKRAEGERLLLERMARGGDLRPFVHALVEAQAARVDEDDVLLERWIEAV
ncbi:MAG: hypothetical protein ACC662_04065, partial [Planctomycetota bacterium]